MRLTIVQPTIGVASETFLHAQATHLPCEASVVHHQSGIPVLDERPALRLSMPARAARKMLRHLGLVTQQRFPTHGYLNVFEKTHPDVVLAQYGPTGVKVMEACHIANLPLVVHFHGYDASCKKLLSAMLDDYRKMFDQASSIIAVSRAMMSKLVEIGAPPEKVCYSPYGVDCDTFEGADPAFAPQLFISVGRFVEKKAPHLTLKAFARARQFHPEAQLRMIGDGPLRARCINLCAELGIADAVTFLGVQSPEVVRQEMRAARAFVQHSMVAPDGDSEGTPVAILEAGATGLPVISTRHAGIPDVVIEDGTGLLVEEGDVQGMAQAMVRLLENGQLAGRMGSSAQAHVRQHYSMSDHIRRLHGILSDAREKYGAMKIEKERELSEC